MVGCQSQPNLMSQTSLTPHGSPYLLGGVDRGSSCGEVKGGGQEEGWEQNWLECYNEISKILNKNLKNVEISYISSSPVLGGHQPGVL